MPRERFGLPAIGTNGAPIARAYATLEARVTRSRRIARVTAPGHASRRPADQQLEGADHGRTSGLASAAADATARIVVGNLLEITP
jgi:hypothetical protein